MNKQIEKEMNSLIALSERLDIANREINPILCELEPLSEASAKIKNLMSQIAREVESNIRAVALKHYFPKSEKYPTKKIIRLVRNCDKKLFLLMADYKFGFITKADYNVKKDKIMESFYKVMGKPTDSIEVISGDDKSPYQLQFKLTNKATKEDKMLSIFFVVKGNENYVIRT